MARILLLFEYSSVNGGENSQLATLETVRSAGHDVVALAPEHGPLALRLASHQVDVIPWSVRDPQGRRRSQADLRALLQGQLKSLRPELIHANSLSMARLVGPVAATSGTPSVGHVRDILRLSRAAMGDVNRNRRLLAVSNAAMHWHLKLGLRPEKTYVLHNGVDLKRFCPRHPTGYLHRELGIPADARLITSVGQLGMRKGLDVWLEAAQYVVERCRDVHLAIVGRRYSDKAESRRFVQSIREFAHREPLSKRVHFLGRRDDVPQILNESSLLVHAARQEPLGRVLLEAGASGTPMVATNVGGTAEILPPADFGHCLVQPENASDLADAVVRLLTDDALRQRLAGAIRLRIEGMFDATVTARLLLQHYDAVLGDR